MKKTILSLFLTPFFVLRLFASAIDVSTLATAGDGSTNSPWTGWDTAITWVGDQEYHFPGGVYCYSVSPNFLKTGIALTGEAGTILKHSGSGNAVIFDNPGLTEAYTSWTENVRFENFIIQGNASTTNGLFLRGVRNGIFKHISVRDVSNAGLWSEACVTNILENFRVTHHEMPNDKFNVVPAYGIVLASRGNDWTTTWTIINPVIEGVKTIGIWTQYNAYGNTFINGTVEGNLGKGMVILSTLNTFTNTDFEVNVGNDIEIWQSRNTLTNIYSSGNTLIMAGQANRLFGGQFGNITIPNNVDFTILENLLYNGTLIDNSQTTIKIGLQATLGGGLRFDTLLNNVIPRMTQLNFSSIVNTDARRSSSFWFAVYSDFTLANPINPTNGQKISWRAQQDAIGGHIINFGSQFKPPPGKALPALSSAGNTYNYFSAIYNSQTNTWDVQTEGTVY